MPIHVEFSTLSSPSATVENALVEQSATVASGAVSFAAPQDGYFTITSTEDGYLAFGHGTPSASADPRRRIQGSQTRSFAAPKGLKVAFTAG